MKNFLDRNRPLRYTLYGVLFVLWLVVLIAPCFAFALAARGELSWDRGEHDRDRIWLIQEKDQRGVGYQAERLLSDQSPTNGSICVRHSVRYFLWEGSAADQNADYCECTTAAGVTSPSACP
jgi:hypothetical protein